MKCTAPPKSGARPDTAPRPAASRCGRRGRRRASCREFARRSRVPSPRGYAERRGRRAGRSPAGPAACPSAWRQRPSWRSHARPRGPSRAGGRRPAWPCALPRSRLPDGDECRGGSRSCPARNASVPQLPQNPSPSSFHAPDRRRQSNAGLSRKAILRPRLAGQTPSFRRRSQATRLIGRNEQPASTRDKPCAGRG